MKTNWKAEFEALRTQLGVAREELLAVQENDSFSRILIQSVKEYAIFMLDAEGQVLTWNPGAERIKQYTCEEVIGKHYRMLYTPDDQAAGRPEKNLRDALKYGQTEDLGWRMKKDGSWFWADCVITPILAQDGRVLGFSKVIRDLTEINKSEKHERELELARRTEKLKDQFLSLVSHELRTPLTSILGFTSLLEDNQNATLSPEQQGYLRHILKGTETLTDLVNNLIDLTTLQAGKMVLEPGPVNFAEVVQGAMFALQPKAQAKHQWFANHVRIDLPDLIADSQRVGQILLNVLDNAVKFTPTGGRIDISATVEDGMLRCEVKDTGPGIEEPDLEKLFQKFSQGDMSSTRTEGGLGIGLNIAKTLAEAHGGLLGVLSTPGQGSTFWFTLPLKFSGAAAPTAEGKPRRLKASERPAR